MTTTPNVTVGDSALRIAQPQGATPERGTSVPGPSALHSAITERHDRPVDERAWLARFGAYMTPPALLAEREPAVDEIREYARRAAYTPKTDGPVRAAGIAWCHAVAVPALVASRLWAWVWQRPARFLVVAATVKALSFLPPVAWAVDHLLVPVLDAAVWLFL